MAISPHDPSVVLAGFGNSWENDSGASTVIRSTDGGETFSVVNQGSLNLAEADTVVHGIVFDSVTNGTVYAATGEGVLKSADNGQNWQDARAGLPGSAIVHELIGVDSSGTFILFATTRTAAGDYTAFAGGGVWRSTDGANTWVEITGDLPKNQLEDNLAYHYWQLAVNPANPNVLYVGTRREEWAYEKMGVFKTTTALNNPGSGVGWSFLWDDPAFADYGWLDRSWWGEFHIGFLALAPADPDTVVAGGDHLYKSMDAGANWTEIYAANQTADPDEGPWSGRGIELMIAFEVEVDPNDSGTWWVAYDDMGLWRTDDDGDSFSHIDSKHAPPEFGDTDAAVALALDPTDSGVVYVGRSAGENDFADNWNQGKVYKTTDSGQTWAQLGVGVLEGGRPEVLMVGGGGVNSRTLLCAIYGDGLFRSTDSGSNWVRVDGSFTTQWDRDHAWSLAAHPGDTSVVYAGIADGHPDSTAPDGGVYKSTDGGQTWTKLASGNAPSGQVLGIDVADDGTVYAATTENFSWIATDFAEPKLGGLYRSADGGATWTRVLDQPRVDSVSTFNGDPTRVVCAASSFFNFHPDVNAGVYISRDSGLTFTYESSGVTHTQIKSITAHVGSPARIFVASAGGGIFVAVDPAPPAIPTIEGTMINPIFQNGDIRLVVHGISGTMIIIQASTNLTTWDTLATATMTTADFEHIDTHAHLFDKRFYRVRIDGSGSGSR